MNLVFLGKKADDPKINWKEWEIQSWITTESYRAGYTFAAGMEGANKGKAGGAKAKATGQAAGEPDLRYYFPDGTVIFIELKTSDGVLSAAQKIRIPKLQSMGFQVEVVYAKSPVDGWNQVKRILDSR